jgi:hypothetical protein
VPEQQQQQPQEEEGCCNQAGSRGRVSISCSPKQDCTVDTKQVSRTEFSRCLMVAAAAAGSTTGDQPGCMNVRQQQNQGSWIMG